MKEYYEKVYKTLAFYQAQLMRRARAIRFDLTAPKIERPVFVVGCSRAGTTLVYKTFSESACLGTLHKETHDFWAQLLPPEERNWESHQIPSDSASSEDRKIVSKFFYTQTGKRRFVDKNNQNGLSIDYLRRLFPDAFFVYVKRNPGDNIHSLMEGWRRAETFATWSDRLPATVNVEQGQFKRWCFFLPKGWRQYLNASIEEVCAYQYQQMNQEILRAKEAVPANHWQEIFYEDILKNPLDSFAEAFEQCQVPFDARVQRHCARVLQNPYNAFSKIGTEKWKGTPDRAKIERVLPRAWPIAEKMGYQNS